MSDAEVIANERAAFAEWYYTKRRDGMSPYEIAVGMHIEHIARCNDAEPPAPQPDSVPQDSGERAAFEHWAFTVHRYRRGNTVQGGYISPPVNGAWEGWKAALAYKNIK